MWIDGSHPEKVEPYHENVWGREGIDPCMFQPGTRSR
jgi:hypothetical protein